MLLLSSSPRLPSPSTFVRPNRLGVPQLKGGSRAQQAPAGASTWFASAGALWREHLFSEPKDLDVDAGGATRDCASQVCNGKLVKPKKRSKKLESGRGSAAAESPRFKDFAYQDTLPGSAKDKGTDIYDVPVRAIVRPATPLRSPSVKLTEYTFVDSEKGGSDAASTKPVKTSKKPRKKVEKPAAGHDTTGVKKPRKRKVKSDAIILNSDDPDLAEPVLPVQLDPQRGEEATKSKRRKPNKSNLPASETISAPHTSHLPSPKQQASVDASADLEHSVYFAKTEIAAPSVEDATAPNLDAAIRRRRSWTPVSDSETPELPNLRPATADSGVSQASMKPTLQMGDVLSKFSYVAADCAALSLPHERAENGQAVTKRRRVEVAGAIPATVTKGKRSKTDGDKPAKEAKKPRKSKSTEEKPAKRPKKPPKKAQTITAMATAAFQPVRNIDAEQGTVSEFFAPTVIEPASGVDTAPAEQPPVKKARKPRKPRVVAMNADGTVIKPKKARKSKVKFNEADDLPKLYSPARATAQMCKQDFLFGTSSQLAMEEPAEFIRDMQAAVQASEHFGTKPVGEASGYEEVLSSQAPTSPAAISPTRKSCTKVATAPHGTCLSVVQAARELWCVGARDPDGGVAVDVEWTDAAIEPMPHATCASSGELTASLKLAMDDHITHKDRSVRDLTRSIVESQQTAYQAQLEPASHLSEDNVSPELAAPGHVDGAINGIELTKQDIRRSEHGDISAALAAQCSRSQDESEDDSWMLLSSEDHDSQLRYTVCSRPVDITSRDVHTSSAKQSKVSSPNTRRSASPNLLRPALRPIDRNANISSVTSMHAGPKRKTTVGLVRRISESIPIEIRSQTFSTQPRKRGRPPKKLVTPSESSAKTLERRQSEITYRLPSQPMPSQGNEWHDIDEISDSDSPTTPSPPRRRANSSSPALRTLQLSPSARVGELEPATASACQVLKPDGPQWPALRSSLFPRITDTIKRTPRDQTADVISWWEKILLYDPVVVEDLTNWLNNQGLSVSVRSQKPKARQKKAKKRKDGELEIAGAAAECELKDEPLQPWMVQKWCEEKSVCCILRDGGWRAGRVR